MRDSFVIDPLIGKRQQLLLATQLCRMVSFASPSLGHFGNMTDSALQVLKINNVIVAGNDENEY